MKNRYKWIGAIVLVLIIAGIADTFGPEQQPIVEPLKEKTLSKSQALSQCYKRAEQCTDIPAVQNQVKLTCIQLHQYTSGTEALLNYTRDMC